MFTVQEQAETNQMDKKAKYREGRGRYDSSSPIRYAPEVGGTSISNETEPFKRNSSFWFGVLVLVYVYGVVFFVLILLPNLYAQARVFLLPIFVILLEEL